VNITLLKSKIHRATVSQTELGYVGSITIDTLLMRAADLRPYEKVMVVDVDNGQRFETYCICGLTEGDGQICINGAAARLVSKGDKVIIMAFAHMTPQEAEIFQPRIVFVNDKNAITTVTTNEIHGRGPEIEGFSRDPQTQKT
jgi:aspartate 1-decarboxylase